MYCTNCGKEMNDNQAICLSCGVKTGEGKGYCPNCGQAVAPDASVCTSCGVALKKANAAGDLGGQSKTTMAVISILVGGLGIHNFMMGETKKGIVKIVASLCCGLGAILALIDFIKILTDKYVIDPEKFI